MANTQEIKVVEIPAFDGTQRIFSFPNSKWEASVVCHEYSLGGNYSKNIGGESLYELAVLFDGNICYTSGIENTEDVIGYLSNDEVMDIIKEIADLK